jgi:hypothetical protein
MGFTVFFFYQLGASTRKWGSQFKLGEVKTSFKDFLSCTDAFPSFKEFLAFPAIDVFRFVVN